MEKGPVPANKQMRVAHVLPFRGVGGTEWQTLRLAQAAAREGYDNLIYFPEDASRVGQLFGDHGFTTKPYRQVEPSLRRPRPFWEASRTLARQMRGLEIELVHTSDVLGARFAGLAGRLAGIKVISHVRNHYPEFSQNEKIFLKLVQKFVFVSKGTQREFGIKVPPKRAAVLYDVPGIGPDTGLSRAEARRVFNLPDDAFVFGMAARLSPQKDFPTLIRAAKIVREGLPQARVLIAGDYELEKVHREQYASLQPLLEETGTRGIVQFGGFQSDMNAFYSAIDAFVISSHWEGLPTVLLEAMTRRKPVVTSNVGGVAEAVIDRQTGLLTPAHCHEMLASQMLRLARDPELRGRLTEAAFHHVAATFGPERFARQVAALYREMLGDSAWGQSDGTAPTPTILPDSASE